MRYNSTTLTLMFNILFFVVQKSTSQLLIVFRFEIISDTCVRIQLVELPTSDRDVSMNLRTCFQGGRGCISSSQLSRVFIYSYSQPSMHSHSVGNSAVLVLLFSAIYWHRTATLAPGVRKPNQLEPRSTNSHS